MGVETNYNVENPNYSRTNFRGGNISAPILAKPIEKVDKVISGTVDTFVKTEENEEEKKSNKTAITVGSSVLVLTGLVALLNPKFSSKLINKLKTMSSKANAKIESNQGNFVKSKFYKAMSEFGENVGNFLQFVNTANACKDIGFKKFCTEMKGVKQIMSKPHKTITNWFDKVSKHTVTMKYGKVNKRLNSLENLISHYKDKLPAEEQKVLAEKLAELKKDAEFFSKEKTIERLINQEKVMSNLEKDFISRLKTYTNGLKDKSTNKKDLIKKNMSYWAEDILMPARNKIEKEGIEAVNKLAGDGKSQKGSLHEIIDILNPHITQGEKLVLEDNVNTLSKKLRKANHSECVDYFDKKRDLTLGGAPTDILTAIFGLGASGIAIGVADTKEEKISRALTGGFPIIAGLGASMAFTAMLFSGVQGMLLGALTSAGLSKIGSIADKIINPKVENKEVTNA